MKSLIKCLTVTLLLLCSINAKAQLIWSDEFDGTSVNTLNWNFEQGAGGWGNQELQYYRPENATVNGGMLTITAKKESFGGAAYTSARIQTANKRTFTYGFLEARCKMPMGQGYWPAFWMIGQNFSSMGWPGCGEIDIMEHVNSEARIVGTIHYNGPNGYVLNNNQMNTTAGDWHNYQIEWTATEMKWFVDGVQYHSVNITNGINSTEEFHKPFFFILNLAIGGVWPGAPTASTVFPAIYQIDYVRAYAQRPSGNTPPTVSITSPSNNRIFTAPANISLAATASDASPGTVRVVEFFNGSTKIGQRTISPYTLTWANVPAGTYTLTAKATDNEGAVNTSVPVTITVNAPGATNLALNKAVAVSSTESTAHSASRGVDGSATTRWSSSFANNQTYTVDLGGNYNINRIRIAWEAAFATSYQLQVSTNNSTWTTIKSITGKTSSAADDHTGLASTARYVRINCLTRATVYGFSFWELQVYGTSAARLGEEETIDFVGIYPNPATERVSIKIPSNFKAGTTFTTVGTTGKVYSTGKVDSEEQILNVAHFPSGIYFINVSDGKAKRVYRFFKQ